MNAEYKRNYDIKTGINSFISQDGGKGSDLPFYLINQKLKQRHQTDQPQEKRKETMKPERGQTSYKNEDTGLCN